MTVKAIELENLDKSVSPADNFYQYTNGGWLNKNEIPGEYSRWGTFEELYELSMSQQKQILEDCLSPTDSDDMNKKAIAIIYSSGMDEEACERHGLSPLSDVFDALDKVQSTSEIFSFAAKCEAQFGVQCGLFHLSSLPDAKNSSWEVVTLAQSSCLGMGDRDFYFREDKQTLRNQYIQHVANILKIVNPNNDKESMEKDAKDMMDLEMKLAEACMTKTEHRDPDKTYNKYNGAQQLIDDISSSSDNHNMKNYFEQIGLTDDALQTIIVDNPKYFKMLTEQFENTSLNVWKTYLTFHIIKSMSKYLNSQVENENFSFYYKIMTGQLEQKPRWKRILNNGVTELLEDSLGLLYTNKHFTADAKNACLSLVNILIEQWRQRIHELDWMKEETKQKALQKLSKFKPLIGFPDKWDIDDIPAFIQDQHISADYSFAKNVRACNVRNFKKVIQRIHKPVDNSRWEMPATIINAYFHPLKNIIVFPAAILQPPFFYHPTKEQPYGDVAINLSAIGAVISHEISHGYDDQGRKFDDNGELVDWWSEEDAKEYEKRAAKMEKLCSDSKIFGENLNGKLCLGENIADYGGVKLAYRGLVEFQQKHGKLDTIDGFTPEQRFFLGWACVWRNHIRKENALQRIIMDPHAPGEFRANIVQVVEEFHQAFNVNEGDAMYQPPDARCQIW